MAWSCEIPSRSSPILPTPERLAWGQPRNLIVHLLRPSTPVFATQPRLAPEPCGLTLRWGEIVLPANPEIHDLFLPTLLEHIVWLCTLKHLVDRQSIVRSLYIL